MENGHKFYNKRSYIWKQSIHKHKSIVKKPSSNYILTCKYIFCYRLSLLRHIALRATQHAAHHSAAAGHGSRDARQTPLDGDTIPVGTTTTLTPVGRTSTSRGDISVENTTQTLEDDQLSTRSRHGEGLITSQLDGRTLICPHLKCPGEVRTVHLRVQLILHQNQRRQLR